MLPKSKNWGRPAGFLLASLAAAACLTISSVGPSTAVGEPAPQSPVVAPTTPAPLLQSKKRDVMPFKDGGRFTVSIDGVPANVKSVKGIYTPQGSSVQYEWNLPSAGMFRQNGGTITAVLVANTTVPIAKTPSPQPGVPLPAQMKGRPIKRRTASGTGSLAITTDPPSDTGSIIPVEVVDLDPCG